MNKSFSCRSFILNCFILIIVLALQAQTADANMGSVNPYYGSFSTEVPIAVPEFHGIQPNVKLVYNSSPANSWVGVGWNLAGFSVISRTAPGGGGPQYNDNDVYMLDGMELVPNCIDQGGNFCTKIQNYAQITRDGENWHVLGTNGNLAVYEPLEVLNQWGTQKWALAKVQDPNGNEVHYTYSNQVTTGDVDVYLETISYHRLLVNGSLTYNGTTITFYREERPDKYPVLFGATLVWTNQRLKVIEIKTGGSMVRAYALEYEQSGSTSRSLLKSVQQLGRNETISLDANNLVTGYTNTVALPPMSFTMQPGSDLAFADSENVATVNVLDAGAGAVNTADFNSDGYMDLFVFGEGGDFTVYYGDKYGTFNGLTAYTGTFLVGGPGNTQFADINGDGQADAVSIAPDGKIYMYPTNNFGRFQDYLFYISLVPVDIPIEQGEDFELGEDFHLADLDGDGRAELIREGKEGTANDGDLLVFFFNESTNEFGPEYHLILKESNELNAYEYNVYFADLNGDGRADLIRHNLNTTGVTRHMSEFGVVDQFTQLYNAYFFSYGLGFADVNGDGAADLIGNDGQGGVHVRLSRGRGLFADGFNSHTDSGKPLVAFADVNADGRTDLIRYKSVNPNDPDIDQSEVFFYLSNGSDAFVAAGSTIGSGAGMDNENGYVRFADIDGNGLPDMIKYDSRVTANDPAGKVYVYPANNNSVPAGQGRWAGPDLMIGLDNGLDGVSDIEYTSSAAWDNTFLPQGFILPTVSSITTRETTFNDESRLDYEYEGGLFVNTEDDRRFLGFRKVTATVSETGDYTETYFFQQEGSTSKPEWTYHRNAAGQIYTATRYEYKNPKDPADPDYAEPPFSSFLEHKWDFACNLQVNSAANVTQCYTSLISFDYDNFGNVTRTYEYGDYDDPDDNRTTIRKYAPIPTISYIVGLPFVEEVREGIGDSGTILQEIWYQYDNDLYFGVIRKGNLTKVTKKNFQSQSSVLGSAEASVSMAYDENGNLTSKTDERGNTTTIQYDPTYNLYPELECNTSITPNQCMSREWDLVMGLLKSSTDVNDVVVSYTYDDLGRPDTKTVPAVTNTQNPGGTTFAVTKYEYLDNGKHIKKTEAYGSADALVSHVYLDGLGRKYMEEKPGGYVKQTHYRYTGEQVEKESLWYASGGTPEWINYQYDNIGRLKKATNPDGNFSTIDYLHDPGGLPYEVRTDEDGRVKMIWKDGYGNVIQTLERNDGEDYITNFVYDLLGNLIWVRDAKGEIRTAKWDSLGRKYESYDPDMGTWTYTYYDDGLLATQTDAKDQTVTFEYDELGRVTTKKDPDGNVVADYRYDEDPGTYGASIGRLTREIYPGGSTTHTWDGLGREIKTVRTVEGESVTIEQGYDIHGRVSFIEYPGNDIVTYHYDSATGMLDSIAGFVNGLDWTASGQLDGYQFANNTSADFTYSDQRLWLNTAKIFGSESSTIPIYDATYTYYDSGLVKTETAGPSNSPFVKNVTYTYDGVKRLTKITGTSQPPHEYDQKFDYDAVGNRTYAHLVTPEGVGPTSAGYTYDANGNMETDGNRVFTWDNDNRLTSVVKNGQTASFLYNPAGDRIRKTSLSDKVTKYFGSLVEMVDGQLVKYYYAGNILVAKNDGDNTHWYHADRLGSIKLITDSNGIQVNDYQYAAFGRTVSQNGTVANEIGYTGHVGDDDIGLIYMKARYYDPMLGRFISPDNYIPDPFNSQAYNRYAYVYNNPINNVDPTGHAPAAPFIMPIISAYGLGGGGGFIAHIAWVGAGLSVAGHLLDHPAMAQVGKIMLGIANGYNLMASGASFLDSAGGILGAGASAASSPLGLMSNGETINLGWAFRVYKWGKGMVKDVEHLMNINSGPSEAHAGDIAANVGKSKVHVDDYEMEWIDTHNKTKSFQDLETDIGKVFAAFEMAIEPYLVAGGLVVGGGVTVAAGTITTYGGYGSMPVTGPAGALVGTTGLVVIAAGSGMVTIGVDIYIDRIRHIFKLPEKFDLIEQFDFFPPHNKH